MTTPDRLAAAVAQGHEDAVQVGPQGGGPTDGAPEVIAKALAQAQGFGDYSPFELHAARVVADALAAAGHLTTPAPVSPPAGEDVERAIYRAVAGKCISNEAANAAVDAVLAALSARPVEAQGTTGDGPTQAEIDGVRRTIEAAQKSAGEWMARAEAAEAEAERLRERHDVHVADFTEQVGDWADTADLAIRRARAAEDERDAALASAEALRAGIEREAQGLASLAKQAEGLDFDPAQKARGVAYRLAERGLRALLDGDGEGRES